MKKNIILAVGILMLTSCMKEQFVLPDADIQEFVCFRASVESVGANVKSTLGNVSIETVDWEVTGAEKETKASPATALSGSVGITAIEYTGTWDESTVYPNTRMKNDEFTVDGDALQPVNPRAWRNIHNEGKIRFFAYAPYGDTEGILSPMDGSVTGTPYVTYTVSDNVAAQADLLYAVSSDYDKSFKQTVPLTFNHALSAIQFKAGFACTVKSLSVKNVNGQGKFKANGEWSELSSPSDYTISFAGSGKSVAEGGVIADGDNTMMMIPQSLIGGAEIELVYSDAKGDHTISAPIDGTSWPMGRKVIYTIFKEAPVDVEYIYFDLEAGNITIDDSTYSGKVFVNGTATNVSGTHSATNKYYIYQSNKTDSSSPGYYKNTGYVESLGTGECRIPQYSDVMYGGQTWADYITDNSSVEDVISNWPSAAAGTKRVISSGTGVSGRQIYLKGTTTTYDIVLDNVWASYENINGNKADGSIKIEPSSNSKTIIRLKGDNRLSNIEYQKTSRTANGYLKFTSFKGDKFSDGSLTVCFYQNYTSGTPFHGDRQTAIGTSASKHCYGIHFDGGTVFVGMGKQFLQNWENGMSQSCTTVIGGGGNYDTEVFISGGKLTAVSGSSSAAIGGSGGHSGTGGEGWITVDDGEVYAYAHGGYHNGYNVIVPVTAIGGGCSSQAIGKDGHVTINGGYVYAQSIGGNAIGGGNAACPNGGNADIQINGGTVVAVSKAGYIADKWVEAGTAIGGGNGGITDGANGGNATVVINNGIVNTGSFGGGSTNNATGKIGSADITINGGSVSGQFLLSAGSGSTPTFTMTGGTIKNSSTIDLQYPKAKPYGGAVYMESGVCTISGGTIANCYAEKGGAIFMKTSGSESPTFSMTGGTLYKNSSEYEGGAVYIEGGSANMTGGFIDQNFTTNGNGGGICIEGGSFTMDGAEASTKITGNAANFTDAGGNGGGIYVTSATTNPSVNILHGTVTGNTADRNGGGIGVDMPDDASHIANITIGVDGGVPASPWIKDNSAGLSGGGLCVTGRGSNVYIYSGTTQGNVSAYVKNEDIRNDGGMMYLYGTTENASVNYITVTFYACTDPDQTADQRIVTSTNSLLTPPDEAQNFTRAYHHLVGWNEVRDAGRDDGVFYSVDGVKLYENGVATGETTPAVINRTSNLSLYAVWELN